MSQENDDVPQEFYDLVDEFINLANRLGETWPSSRVSSAILFAAARYNAFNFYALEANPESNRVGAAEYFCEQYKMMLLSNLDALAPEGSPDGQE
ncbi:MAG TPA: DUF3144 domain-containing protein [Pyrinomonadaceae bacterium]|jgi:hypothetical protein